MKAEILTLLRTTRDYVSGQDLCARFGVSRTAVWKAINQLKEEGYEIEALQNKGYILRSYPDILSKNEIVSRLATKWVGKTLYYYEDTDSTNADAMRLGEEGAEHGTLVIANHQNKGRGRRGRVWQSPVGTTISMSFLVKPQIAPSKASMLTLVMALAVAKGIEEACDLPTAIKWPNDILVNGKKVCGILTEMKAEMDYIHGVIIGVGINVNVESFPEDLQSMATSLLLEKGRKVSRAEVIERVVENFEEYYEKFIETEDLSLLQDLYEERLISKGKAVKVLDPQGEYTGISKGITNTGELLVETPDGKEQHVYAGEVSVRGIYGYV